MRIVNKLSALAKRVLPGKFRTLYKAGLMDANLELTEKGAKELEAIVVEAHLEELIKVAEARLKKEKK